MRYLINKLLLFLISFVLIINTACDETEAVVFILIAVILSGIYALPLDKNKHYRTIMDAIFSICICMGIRFDEVIILMPVLAYDLYLYQLKLGSAFAILVLVYSAFYAPLTILFVAILCVVAVLFAYDFKVISNFNLKIHNMQDISTEKELLMTETTRQLIKNQDNEITNATLKERNRIAREIHDNVGHLLTRSILQVGVLKVINHDDKVSDSINELHDTLNTAMTSMRNSVHDLYDESVDLKSSIERIVNDINEAGSMSCFLDYDCSNVVSKEIKYAFISITKEAVNNALKHSNGDTIRIDLQEHPGFYRLSIEDNGKDKQSFTGNDSGIGMLNIKDRIDALGGTLRVITDKGFKIVATVMKKD